MYIVKFVFCHIENDDSDILTWINVDNPLLEVVSGDGEYLMYSGDKILEVYEIEGCGIWRESPQMYHDLVNYIKNERNK